MSLALAALFSLGARAQSVWQVPHRDRDVIVDGFIQEWQGVPALVVRPGAPAVENNGAFEPDDVEVTLQAVWDKEALYVAVRWKDNVWDTQEVRRRDAVFITADKKRRDRMYFFDNLAFQIPELEYDYLLWVSPRIDDHGPYHWQRRLEGLNKREAATPSPVITPRQMGQEATLELLFRWKDLEIKPEKRKNGLPLLLQVADSDWPGLLLESKVEKLKWLLWRGTIQFGRKP